MFIPDNVIYNRQATSANSNSRFNHKKQQQKLVIRYIPEMDGKTVDWLPTQDDESQAVNTHDLESVHDSVQSEQMHLAHAGSSEKLQILSHRVP
jgi:hypothetical protein